MDADSGSRKGWRRGAGAEGAEGANGDGHSSAPTGAGGTGTSTGAAKCPVSGAQGSLLSADGSDTTAQPRLLRTQGSLWGHLSRTLGPALCVWGCAGCEADDFATGHDRVLPGGHFLPF